MGGNVGEAVNFSAGIAPAGSGPVTVTPVASNVQPGQSDTVRLPAPGANGIVDVRIVGVGATSGRVLLDNTRELECLCPDQPTTTQPTTTTTPVLPTTNVNTTVPEQVTTTVPGTPTTAPAVATSVRRGTTVPLTLPETGGGNGAVAISGVVLLLLGTSALVVGAFVRRGPAEEG